MHRANCRDCPLSGQHEGHGSETFAQRPCHRLQGALLLDFLAEPLYIDSVVVATQAHASADSSAAVASGDQAAATHAAAEEALSRALDSRTQSLAARLEPPFRRCPPVVSVMRVLPSDSCFRPSASRRVPSGAPLASHDTRSILSW